MRLMLVLLMVWSCSTEDDSEIRIQDTSKSNIIGEQISPWTISTSEQDKDDTIDTHFVNRRAGYPSDCVVINANQSLLNKVDEMLEATTDGDYRQKRNDYRDALADFDILCYARYHTGRKDNNNQKKYRYLISFYHGTSLLQKEQRTSYQVTCYVEQNTNSYICRDIVFQKYNKGKNFTVVKNKDSVGNKGINDEIKALDYYEFLTYDGGKKMLRVPSTDLKARMREISPENSQEIPEYQKMSFKGRGKNWVQNIERFTYIDKYGNDQETESLFGYRPDDNKMIGICKTAGGGVGYDRRQQGILEGDPYGDNGRLVWGFKKVPVCEDLFLNPYNGNCNKKPSQISVCKLRGRGILIKWGKDKILRVANCEYQPHAKHFYCSGKEPGITDKPPKIYFERYGVFVEMRSLPNTDCRVMSEHITDSIGCGSCARDRYNFVDSLDERGCDYKLPYYCNFFSELEESWNDYRYGIDVPRPDRCHLESTCVFRRSSSVSDNPPCIKNFKELLIDVETNPTQGRLNGCSTKFNNGDRCHFMQRQELE